LTGRETKANFVAMQGEFPHVVPNVFLGKGEVAFDPELLFRAVAAGYDYLENLENSIDSHGLEIALEISSDWRF
jgi:hypothetical protein